ncbi:type II 3-dehydroquinate dehydratase [Aureibacter tunicatorum]|uniref:3-dehydroquinate dehydratase n=1 Tax=Aureibacter tunicatorum TaxID=866807 RepID=A0AAE4BQE4_9BACT|nr:type II 3-dehydroquinate dehydratase [Aureibacter tunicatorum]MDR6239019.1 3-dehydroquinate dehydratase-2 [Aureibacter tunicatorum]BDD05055.1 3-dehydroquinate dehydratase [Aureibacter tunicatorum]
MRLIVINGPNLNLLGVREKSIYGDRTFEDFFMELKEEYDNVELFYFQSNHEGSIIDKIHEIGFDYDGIILNAGAYTHTSVAIADALAAVTTPAVEVHISNIHKRESFRHHSYLTPNCIGMITGLGLQGYKLAIEYFINK